MVTLNNPYGVDVFNGGSALSNSLNLTQLITDCTALGVAWLRVHIQWKNLESPQGSFTQWGGLDQIVAAANAANINVCFPIESAPTWALTTASQEATTEPFYLMDPTLASTFATQVATRYNGGAQGFIAAIEVGNEDFQIHYSHSKTETLNQNLTNGTAYSSINVQPTARQIVAGAQIQFGNLGGSGQLFVVSSAAAAGATTLSITAVGGGTFTANQNYLSGSTLTMNYLGLRTSAYAEYNGTSSISANVQPGRDPYYFVQALSSVSSAIRAASPSCLVGAAAIWWQYQPNIADFLAGAYAAGMTPAMFDYANLHFYRNNGTVDPIDPTISSPTFPQAWGAIGAALTNNNDAAKPLWVTEFGWATSTNYGRPGTITPLSNALSLQALYYQELLDSARQSGVVAKAFFYTLNYNSDGMSLVQGSTAPFTYLPAFTTVKNYIAQYPQWTDTYEAAVLADAPQAYYRLDETGGTLAKDSSGHGYNGAYSGSGLTLNQPGLLANNSDTAAIFDGIAGEVACPAGLSPTGWTACTIEAWIKLSANSFAAAVDVVANAKVASSNNGLVLAIGAGAASVTCSLGNGTGNSSVTSAVSFAIGAIHHLCATWNGATMTLYIDGVSVATASHTGAISASTKNVALGYNPVAVGNYFPGSLDEVAIYNTALSAARVTVHYNAGTAPPPTFAVTSPTTLTPTTPGVTPTSGTYSALVTLVETSSSIGIANWTISSSMAGVTFSPTSGALTPGNSVVIAVYNLPTVSGTLTIAGAEGETSVVLTWTYTPPLTNSQSIMDLHYQKIQQIKVYDAYGVYLGIWVDAPPIAGLRDTINACQSPIKLVLPRKIDSFDGAGQSPYRSVAASAWGGFAYGSGIWSAGQSVSRTANTVAEGNTIKVFLFGPGLPASGLLKFQGYIDAIEPTDTDKNAESVTVTITPFNAAIADHGYGGTLAFTSVDPIAIFNHWFTTIDPIPGGGVTYANPLTLAAGNPTTSGLSVNYNVTNLNLKSIFDTVMLMLGDNWYWRPNSDNTVVLKQLNTAADHTVILGQHMQSISYEINNSQRYNVIYFVGSAGISAHAVGASAKPVGQGGIGEKIKFLQDSRITDNATAQIIANVQLALYDQPFVRAKCRLVDYRGDSKVSLGADIEAFHVGETVSIIDGRGSSPQTQWGNFQYGKAQYGASSGSIFNTPVPIQAITYGWHYIDVELGSLQPSQDRRLFSLEKKLNDFSLAQ